MKKIITLFIITAIYPALFLAQSFTKITDRAGFGNLRSNTGTAVADYDADGDLDIFIVGKRDYTSVQPSTHSRLFANNNDGTFTDVTVTAGFDNLYDYDESDPGWNYGVKIGAAWGDYDNDGFPDLCLTNYQRVQLFHNEGNGTFAEVTAAAGFPVSDSCYYTSALWWDLNNDGFLDVYLSRWRGCENNSYYENNGDGTFTEKTNALGLGSAHDETWMSIPLDVNADGMWDLYLANDFARNELFVQNADGTFSDRAADYNLDIFGNDMGIAYGDYDNNGDFDIFVSNIGENRLFSPSADGSTYTNIAEETGVFNTYWAWGCRFADFDLDGDEDLFVANGFENDFIQFPALKTNFLFKNLTREGQNTFADISTAAGVAAETNTIAVNIFDYDSDGDHDIFTAQTNDIPTFYENEIIDENAPENLHWTGMKLEGTTSNRAGLGAYVKIWTDGQMQQRLYTGTDLLSQSLRGVHFGLGAAATVDSMEVKWSSGITETHYDLPADIYLQLTEEEGYTVLDLESQKIYGCLDSLACNYNAAATVSNNGCTYRMAPSISGNENTTYLATETYTTAAAPGSTFRWKIENGHILGGQGTPAVTVQWEIAETGRVELRELNDCVSEAAVLNVNLSFDPTATEHSIARLWNEALLFAIRNDFARPTVHARNLHHLSAAMYDAWAIYDAQARPYLIGNTVGDFTSDFTDFTTEENRIEARRETISFAAYRLLHHRFLQSPSYLVSKDVFNRLFAEMSYDADNTSTDYANGDPAALGNFIAQTYIDFGMQDGATELQGYANAYYEAVNPPLVTNEPGNPNLRDPNRWQPLAFETFIDQSGNLIEGTVPDFLSPEWGNVTPFALDPTQAETYVRDGDLYNVFTDPGAPPYLDTLTATADNAAYRYGFSLVSVWASHLTAEDGVMWDISPAGIGNLPFADLPRSVTDYPDFYNLIDGGDGSPGHRVNPVTGAPYPPQIVPRGDYTRVLAEFWADGPDSETPPGHWFTILNKVNDDPDLVKKLGGKNEVLPTLEWDVKSYFILGAAMHDAAIAAWSVKGWYDYIRPISAIRYMAEKGQSTDPNLPNYHVAGIGLIPGYIEQVQVGDALAGADNRHVGKIKLYTWRGHPYINDPATEAAGVDWILAEDWLPYQRISFVTPPFAGYVSGHSTYSRAAAEVMTLLTGDAFFPGGAGEFIAYKNDFLVFEDGPSQDVVLQWATYRDASDQCSLSRIWGGIHPPADDLPGRIMGEKVGKEAFAYAVPYFSTPDAEEPEETVLYPNPAGQSATVILTETTAEMTFAIYDVQGRRVTDFTAEYEPLFRCHALRVGNLASGVYFVAAGERVWKLVRE